MARPHGVQQMSDPNPGSCARHVPTDMVAEEVTVGILTNWDASVLVTRFSRQEQQELGTTSIDLKVRLLLCAGYENVARSVD